jgi:hypothetical protein
MQAIEMDFALGSAIADDIVPSAFKYFTGQAQLEASSEGGDYDPGADDDDDDDEDDDDEDDDGDEDFDDDADPAPPAKGKEGECKQQ